MCACVCVCVCVYVCVCACVQTHVHTSEKQRPDGLTPLLCLCPDHALCQRPCKEVPQEAVKDCQNLPLVSWMHDEHISWEMVMMMTVNLRDAQYSRAVHAQGVVFPKRHKKKD